MYNNPIFLLLFFFYSFPVVEKELTEPFQFFLYFPLHTKFFRLDFFSLSQGYSWKKKILKWLIILFHYFIFQREPQPCRNYKKASLCFSKGFWIFWLLGKIQSVFQGRFLLTERHSLQTLNVFLVMWSR